MSYRETRSHGSYPVRIPSDINRPDRVIGPFTARQAALLAGTGGGIYLLWGALRDSVPTPVFLACVLPVAAIVFAVIVGRRDGLPLDRLLVAAVRHLVEHRTRPPVDAGTDRLPPWLATHTSGQDAPSGRGLGGFPVRSVGQSRETAAGGRRVGIVDVGGDGLVAVATVATVHFGLCTPAEQDGLVAGFGRYLHSLTGPVQILIRALPLDLTEHLQALHTHAAALPHPALAAAARAHLAHLAQLAHHGSYDSDNNRLLSRQVLLVLREPHRAATTNRGGPARGGEQRLLRRLHDAAALLAPLGTMVTPLDGPQLRALLASTCNPDQAEHPNTIDSPPARYRPSPERARKQPVHTEEPWADDSVAGEPEVDEDGWGPDQWVDVDETPPEETPEPARRWFR